MQKTTAKPTEKKTASTLTKNVVQFRSNFVNLPFATNPKDAPESNRQLVMVVASELMQFGYILEPQAIENMAAASRQDIIAFHNEVISYLKKMTGSNRNYKAFWPGFPEQVMEKSEFELWINQIVHYMSNGTYMPNDWTKERPTAFEQSKYYNITVGDEARFEKIFTDLTSVNQSLTPDDLDVVKFFVESGSVLRFPDQIPFKENLCTLAAMGLDVPVKTVTDVLRIAVGMSGGDISLPKVPHKLVKTNRWSSHKSVNPARENFKFKKFSRSERKQILRLLDKTNCDITEAVLKDQRWVRLGEILHPGEYKATFPKAFSVFDAIRNEKVQSWYGKVNAAFKLSFEEGVKVLSQRPGEFMRRLDWLIRTYSHKETEILATLSAVASKVSNKVLYEAYTHFEGRLVDNHNRTIMVKGARKKTKLPDLYRLDKSTVSAIQNTITRVLVAKFSSLPKLGKVYVDEQLKNIPLPANMRSASSGLRPRIRGQRIPIGNENSKVIRAFVHWFDENGNQDIDLTCTYIGMGKTEHVGWNGTHNGKYGIYSGDVRHHRGACAEYVDIIVGAALKDGFKYVVVDARNYNGRSFETVTDCVAGYMEREVPKASKTFVPATIANCTRLTNASSTTLISVIDLETREYIHLDIDQDGIPVASANFNEILNAIKPYCEAPKFSVYDLILLHVDARGGDLVPVDEKADTYFSFEEFSNSYVETLRLMGV
jgi:hypothetical protein